MKELASPASQPRSEPVWPQETVGGSVRVVRTYSQEKRFRRDVLEGTLEELEELEEEQTSTNKTRRQADFPGEANINNTSGK